MAELINCRLSDESLATLHIEQGLIKRVVAQSSLQVGIAGTTRLTDVDDFARLTDNTIVDAAGGLILPGMIDVHVHSRDPGLTHKENWQNLATAAFKGGVVAVCDMPNTKPVTIDRPSVLAKMERAAQTDLAYSLFVGVSGHNVDQLPGIVDDETLPICGLKVFYGQSTGPLQFDALERLDKALRGVKRDILMAFHAEDQTIIDQNTHLLGASHTTSNAADFRIHSQLRDENSAIQASKRILDWALVSGRRAHICHVSTPAEVALVIDARARGARVTMEVAPHHLWFNCNNYDTLGGFLKMNPPVREPASQQALLAAFARGDIDLFATDHAPHTIQEKHSSQYADCPAGVPSIEFFLPLLLTLGKRQKMRLTEVVKMATCNAAHIFQMSHLGEIAASRWASFVLVEEAQIKVTKSEIIAQCGWSPYEGESLSYRVGGTWQRGKQVYKG